MRRKRVNDVYETAKDVGLYVATWSPGDGVTRYRFLHTETDYFVGSYHPASDNYILYTALGRKEALVWLAGYEAGRKVYT